MSYIHYTADKYPTAEEKKYANLVFDEVEVHHAVKQQVAKKFMELENEVDAFIIAKAKEFKNFLDSKNLESTMGSIGKKEVYK